MNDKQAITSHFMTHFGVPERLIPPPGSNDSVALMVFKPLSVSASYLIATNGMSSFIQRKTQDGEEYRTELFVMCHRVEDWIVSLMFALSSYPAQYQAPLFEFDTLDVETPFGNPNSPWNALFIASPQTKEPETLGAFRLSNHKSVLVHQVVGITSGERDVCRSKGGQALARFLSPQLDLCIDGLRKPNI